MKWIKKARFHIASQNESYLQHFIHASKIGLLLATLATRCFIHAVFPFLFTTTVSDNIEEVKRLTNRK
jgi:hypothetical protein